MVAYTAYPVKAVVENIKRAVETQPSIDKKPNDAVKDKKETATRKKATK